MKKDYKVQNGRTQTIEKYNKESFSTQTRIRQKTMMQNKIFERAINIMGVTFEDMDIEMEQKDKKK